MNQFNNFLIVRLDRGRIQSMAMAKYVENGLIKSFQIWHDVGAI